MPIVRNVKPSDNFLEHCLKHPVWLYNPGYQINTLQFDLNMAKIIQKKNKLEMYYT